MGDSDRDLLFATLALQSNLISQDQLASCMNELAAGGGKPLAEVLREHGALTDDDRRRVEGMMSSRLSSRRPGLAWRTALVTALVVSLLWAGASAWLLHQEQAKTARALEQAEASRQQAEANLQMARKAVDDCFLMARDHPAFQQPGMDKARKLLLTKTLPFYAQLRDQKRFEEVEQELQK